MSEKQQIRSSIWRNNIFMRMFASYSVSMMGNYFDMIALMVLFGYVWQVEPILISLIPVAMALPQALLSQFVGVLTDRVDRVKIMMISDFLTAILTLLLLLATHPWVALCIISLRSIVNVVHYPAQQGLIKLVVSERHLVKAVSLNGMMMQFSKIVAPLIGGILVSTFSPQLCILINAIAFIVSALILLSILVKKELKIPKDSLKVGVKEEEVVLKSTFWQSWREGWTNIFQSRNLWVSFLFFFLSLLIIQMIDIQLITWLREIAPSQPGMIGWIAAASGFGAVLIMLFLNRYEKLRGYGWLMGGSLVCLGIGYGGMGFLWVGFPVWIALLYGVFAGGGVGLYTIGFQYIMQTHTLTNNIGRIAGISNSIASSCIVIGPLIGGGLIQVWGAGTIFVFIGIICTIVGILGILFQRFLWKEEDSHTQLNGGYKELVE